VRAGAATEAQKVGVLLLLLLLLLSVHGGRLLLLLLVLVQLLWRAAQIEHADSTPPLLVLLHRRRALSGWRRHGAHTLARVAAGGALLPRCSLGAAVTAGCTQLARTALLLPLNGWRGGGARDH
jgi:hypothetical protein